MTLTANEIRQKRVARFTELLHQRFNARYGNDIRRFDNPQRVLDIYRGLAFELLGEQDETLDIAQLMSPMLDAIQLARQRG